MNILLIYATYSSGTQIASKVAETELIKQKHTVIVKNVAEVEPHDFIPYDLIILASPSWWNNNKDGMPHHLFLSLMDKMQGMVLENKKFAIFGLGDAAYARFCGAVDHLEQFVSQIKGEKIIDSLRIEGFYFDQNKNEELIRSWVKKL